MHDRMSASGRITPIDEERASLPSYGMIRPSTAPLAA